ncbi:MAG: hormogonium polysaccharide biosynthesis glycosyltransferase HpsE [Cyanobacteria bacterium P01_C01_bin.120]
MIAASLFHNFTVAIPTYNGAQRIPYVLECLRWQLGTDHISWEIIVVDNNSTDDTELVVREFQKGWPNLRYAFEPKQGAAFARQRAIRLARSPLVGFLDDDNLPSIIWINQAVKFFREHPQAGIVGSHIRGKFDCDLPANFDRIAAFLALTYRGPSPLIYSPDQKVLPPGAGMAVRRHAWLENVPENPILCGPTKDSVLSSEDLEATLHIQKAGWEVWYNPAMRVEHKIPARRLTQKYLCSLMKGAGLSRHRTRMLSVKKHHRYFMTLAYAINDVRKIVRHIVRYRAAVWRDPVTASEMTLYIYSLISPFFFLKRRLDKTWPDSKLGEVSENPVSSTMQDQHT